MQANGSVIHLSVHPVFEIIRLTKDKKIVNAYFKSFVFFVLFNTFGGKQFIGTVKTAVTKPTQKVR